MKSGLAAAICHGGREGQFSAKEAPRLLDPWSVVGSSGCRQRALGKLTYVPACAGKSIPA
jgi:hypothetical protein